MDSRAVNNSTPLGNPVNPDALEPLLTLALGASEEVNTTAGSKVKSDKNSYMLRSKSSKTKERYTEDSIQGVFPTTPLNSPIIINPSESSSSHQSTSSKDHNISERVVPANNTDLTEVLLPQHLNLVQVHTVSESVTNGNTEVSETASLPAGLVMIEQSVLEQINGILKNAGAVANDNIQKIITSTVTPNVQITSSVQDEQTEIQSNTSESTYEANVSHQPVLTTDEDEWIDTKATALQLTDELRRYHIPQAVFAKKVLNRSQGTLSDILRKPKPWNEMRLGKEIFRKMKEWLSLPEVKRIPQLRMEAAKDLDSRSKRHISTSEDIMQEGTVPKKVRRQFTEAQKRALFAIFKETKKPTKEMQKALAEELGLDVNTVSNFFMNARRRYASE